MVDIPELQDVLRDHLYVLNQVFALKRRLRKCEIPEGTLRPLERIEEYMAANLHVRDVLPDGCGLVMVDPLGESYDDRRTELEADVIGAATGPLFIVDVLRPIIRLSIGARTYVLQRGAVTVAPETEEGGTT
jgi:hypothetical protein